MEYCQAFAALLSDCEVTDLQLVPRDPPGTDITYEITNNADILNVLGPLAVYTPQECVYDLTFTAKVFNSNDPLPSFLIYSEEEGFNLETNNPDDFGVNLIELTASINGPNSVGNVDIIYTFTLGRCQLDFVTQSSPIGSISYVIGTGPLIVLSNIENKFEECPLSFELT